MNGYGLAIKDVQFNGATLRAAQDAENIIWVGVRWICQGLGLSEDRIKYERKKIQKDLVLVQGVKFYPLGSGNSDTEMLCLKLDFLPLWLAKISITPTMKTENPQLVENQIEYQLKAKDVLASAFLNKDAIIPVENYSQQIADLQNIIMEMRQENQKMYKDMSALANIILDWKESIEKNGLTKPALPEVSTTSSWKSWKETMYQKMDHICANATQFGKRNDVMKWLYRYMNKKYGVVWDQEEREYKERNHTSISPSTIDIVLDKPMIKSIFESVLADLEYEYCHQSNAQLVVDPEDWIDEIIAPLIAKYDDHSKAAMVTYRRVYRKMNEMYKISWSNLTTRYINENGKKPSHKDLIKTRPSLRKKFEGAVKELMEE